MSPQEIINLMSLKLEAARAVTSGAITKEQYVGIYNVGAMLSGEAHLPVPGLPRAAAPTTDSDAAFA